MASLNWAVLDSNTLVPVPLPREKVLLSLASVTLALAPSSPPPASARSTARPIEYKVEKGTVYLSNQRVVYVAPPNLAAQDATAASSGSTTLETLSCPYTHFQDGRLNQPFFGANNFEAVILPARQGGLSGPHTVRLYFKEGGGFDFYSTVLEMKERLASAPRSAGPSAAGEDLPLYTANSARPSQSRGSAPRSMPSNSDLAAASIAREAELDEDDERARPDGSTHVPPPPPPSLPTPAPPSRSYAASQPPPIGDDAPPKYEA